MSLCLCEATEISQLTIFVNCEMSLCLREETKISQLTPGGPCTWVYFCWVCAAGLSEPLPPLQSILWPIVYPIVTFGQICNFCDPSLVTFYFYELTHSFRLNEKQFTFHPQYKHSGTFANRACQWKKKFIQYDSIFK